MWSLSTERLLADFSTVAARTMVAAADPAGTLVLAGSQDGVVTALDIARPAPLWQARAHRGQVISVAIGQGLAASGGTDTLAHVWRAGTGERVRTIATENGTVRNLTFDASGTRLAAAGQWRTRLRDLEDGSRPSQDFGRAEGMTDVHIRPDLRFLATCHGAWAWCGSGTSLPTPEPAGGHVQARR